MQDIRSRLDFVSPGDVLQSSKQPGFLKQTFSSYDAANTVDMIPQLLWVSFHRNGQVFLCLFVRFGEEEVVCEVLCLRYVQRTHDVGGCGRRPGKELFNETLQPLNMPFSPDNLETGQMAMGESNVNPITGQRVDAEAADSQPALAEIRKRKDIVS